MTGALENIFNLTIEYVKEWEQFRRPIGKFQAVKQQLSIMTSHIVSANVSADFAIKSFDENCEMTTDVIVAKIQLGEVASKVTTIAHQVHGSIGITKEYSLQFSTR